MARRDEKPVRILFGAAARPKLLAGVANVVYGEFAERCQLLVEGVGEAKPMGFYDAAVVRLRGGELDHWRLFSGPTVVVNNAIDVPYPQVVTDDRAVGRMAAGYFLRRGFRRFVYAGDRSRFSRLRRRAFVDALSEAGITDAACAHGSSASHIVPVRELVSRYPGDPLAVFCCNDWRANALLNRVAVDGIKCPRDIAVMGVDNDPVPNSCCHVSISSIEPSDYELGQRAAQLLVGLLRGDAPPGDPILIPPLGIVGRRSTDRYATDNPVLERAVRYMEANLHRSISVAQIARAASGTVALRTLQRHFRQTFGETMVEALLRARVERAKNLLASDDLSIKEIAYLTGFASPSHFGLTFRRFEGVNPGQYRQRTVSV